MLTDVRIDCGLKHRLNTQSSQAILLGYCLLYTSPSPRDTDKSRMPSSA